MRLHQAIYLVHPDSFYEGDIDTPPKWCVKGHIAIDNLLEFREGKHLDPPDPECSLMEVRADAKHCPFCGTPVPEIEKLTVDVPICTVTDGGYYCDTCSKRLNECKCYPPEWPWKVKFVPALYGDWFVGVWRCSKCKYECFPRQLREADAQPPFLCPEPCASKLEYDEEA